MKNSCSSASKLLEKYFDQEVTNEERSLVESHLMDCPACRDELKLMEGLRDIIRIPVEEAVKKEDFPWVWQKIEREIQTEERPNWLKSLRLWIDVTPILKRKVWVPAVAVMAILILIVTPALLKKTSSYPSPFVVEYVESQTNNVMVYESEKAKVTVIWLFEGPEMESPAS